MSKINARPRPLDQPPSNDAGACPAELPDDMGADRARTPAPALIKKGTVLQARDGTLYLVERVTRKLFREPVPGGLDKVVTRHTLTLARALPKIRGKAAVKAAKRARHADVSYAGNRKLSELPLTEATTRPEGSE